MAIVANGDIEKLKSLDCSSLINDTDSINDISILNSIYKFKKNPKFTEGSSQKKKIKVNKMTNGLSSPDSSQNANSSNSTSLSSKVNSDSDQTPPLVNQQSESSNKTISSPKISADKAQESIHSSAKSNSNNPIASSSPSTVDKNVARSLSKQTNLQQSNLSAINGQTISPSLTSVNKFSIANILNEDCEAIDANSRKNNNQSVPLNLPPNANSLLAPNMMLNQNDLNALSSLNLIAWQASYAAQHAQAGKSIGFY